MGVGVCPSGRMLSDLCRNPSNFKLSNPAECESPTEVKVCQPLQKKQQMAAGGGPKFSLGLSGEIAMRSGVLLNTGFKSLVPSIMTTRC